MIIAKGLWVVLTVNGLPVAFPASWVSESHGVSSSYQSSTNPHDPLILLPNENQLKLKIVIPQYTILHSTGYEVAKKLMMAMVKLFQTTHSEINDGDVTASNGIALLQGWRHPFSRGDSGESGIPGTLAPSIPSTTGTTDTLSNNISELNDNVIADSAIIGTSAKDDYAKMAHWVQVFCVYFGRSSQILCGAITNFGYSSDPQKCIETWDITVMEYEFRTHTQKDVTPIEEEVKKAKEKLKEKTEGIGTVRGGGIRAVESQANEFNPTLDRALREIGQLEDLKSTATETVIEVVT